MWNEGEVGMIQIEMPMPENCRMCPVCSEYDICLIPVDGKGFGDQNVSEFTEGRPEWCPLKEQEAVAPKHINGKRNHFIKCGNCNYDLLTGYMFCPHCGKAVKWE